MKAHQCAVVDGVLFHEQAGTVFTGCCFLRFPASKTSPVIEGSVRVYSWPQVLHLCLNFPATLTEVEVFEEGLDIDGVHYNFSGLIHKRRGDVWDVSVRRLSGTCQPGWYSVKKNSKGKHSSKEDVLSDVVMVQLRMAQSSPSVTDNISDGRVDGITCDAPQVIVILLKFCL